MKIKQITERNIKLTLPTKVRYLGLIFTIIGIIIPIYLFILNDNKIYVPIESNLNSLIWSLGLSGLLGYIIGFEVPSIYYFFRIRNSITFYGHILLLVLNIMVYIGTYSLIFAFSPFLITGIYFLTHSKMISLDGIKATLEFHERIFLFFISRNSIPFSEIKEFVLEYAEGLGFLNRGGKPHRYRIQLYLLETDPGFEDEPIAVEDEEDSLEFFRPQTLRKTLISKPILIDSSLINYNNDEMVKLNQLIKEIMRLTEFSYTEETIKNKKHVFKLRK
ncbi:MAG: hypothetical protein HWN66_12835 [Candidatus Helarchaeota archaeon]|nr:hypothetical protein [Candidatus Helarchaeota archaeon]